MARYSSESDSDHNSRYRRRRSRRSRSSSSESSDSSSYRKRSSKHSKPKRRHRSHSRSRVAERDRSQKSYKGSRNSSSKDRDKRKYHSSKARSRSTDRLKRKIRSTSREKSGSRSSSSQSNVKTAVSEKQQTTITKDAYRIRPNLKKLVNKVRSMKLQNNYTSLMFTDDFPIEPRFKDGVIEEINSESFTPKQFSSSKERKFKNIVIDITADTIQVPTVTEPPCGSDSIFHSTIMLDQEVRFDRWVKKLYTLRQKAIVDLMHSNLT